MALIVGTASDDTLTGTSGNDTISGGDGNDVLIAAGNQTTLGGIIRVGSGTGNPSFSPDGQELAYSTDAFVVPSAAHPESFILNLSTGTTTPILPAGILAWEPVFSPDGKKVAFVSSDPNLVPGDTNGHDDIFIEDLTTGAITRVSVTANGTQANANCTYPLFSPDGTELLFCTTAGNLVPGQSGVFVKNLISGQLISASNGVSAGYDYPSEPVFSPDSTKVAYAAGDDVFVTDPNTGVVTLAGEGSANGNADYPFFFPDGRLGFRGPLQGQGDLYVKDLATGAVTLLTSSDPPKYIYDTNKAPTLSADGTVLAFDTDQIVVVNLTTGEFTRVSTAPDGSAGNDISYAAVISPDASKVAFASVASNLVPGDTANSWDLFVATLQNSQSNDLLDGGPGTDTAVIPGARSSYTITENGTSFFVDGPNAHHVLTGIEIVKFDDATVYLDVPIEAYGATILAAGNNHFFLHDNTGAGPTVKFGSNDVVAGQFGAWTPIAAEATASGYEIAWKAAGADQYSVWSTDANGNYIANLIPAVSGNAPALVAAETLFQQDLNGDGQIGNGRVPIETHGATTLAMGGNHFYLQDNTGAGPSLKFGGNDVVAGQFGAWTPIAAETTGSGYEVAWKVSGLDQYSVWSTDTNGNYIANLVPAVTGSDPALVATEAFFQQDLNGDGQISSARVPIESHGATTLAIGGTHFYLQDNMGAGPSLKFGGNDVVAGQFGAWTPIAAETTGSGYEVAWKATALDQYSVWSTDANGNYLANLVPAVTGNDPALVATESFFQQDLNGDGQISSAHVPIETHGATTLATGNNHFYLQDHTGAGPSLKFGGNDVVAGQFGGWAPIAAEATLSGYEVAWKVTGADQYSVWSTDANGNYTGNVVPAVAGNDPALVALEASFQQDLNGDGLLG